MLAETAPGTTTRRTRWRRFAVATSVVVAATVAMVAARTVGRAELPAVLWTRHDWRTGSPLHVAPGGPIVPGWHLDLSVSGTGDRARAVEDVGPGERLVRRLRDAIRPPSATIYLFQGVGVDRFGSVASDGVLWHTWVAPSVIPDAEFVATTGVVGMWRFASFDGGGPREVVLDAGGRIADAAAGTVLGAWGEARGFVRVRAREDGKGWARCDIHVFSPDGDALLRTTGGDEIARRARPGR